MGAGLSRFPGYYDVTFGGAVGVGETYEVAAARELHEELGVDAVVRPVCRFLCRSAISPYWLGVHETVLASEIDADRREITWHGWLTATELTAAARTWQFVPDGQGAFDRYVAARTD